MTSTTTTSTAVTSTAMVTSTAVVTSTAMVTSTGMVTAKQELIKNKENMIVGLNYVMPNAEIRNKYIDMCVAGKIDQSVSGVLSYVGSVIYFLSYFMGFITRVTDKVKSSPIPKKFQEEISQILPDEYKDESNYKTMLDLSRLIHTMIREYSTTVLLAMGSIKMLPQKVEKIQKTMLRYKKRNKRMAHKSLVRVIKLDDVRTHFQNLKSTSDSSNKLAEVFFSAYMEVANVNNDLQDYTKQIREIEKILRNLKKEVSNALVEKVKEESEAKNSLERKEMYDKNVKNLEDDNKNGKSVWENIIDEGIKNAEKEKLDAEERLRKYTYRMYGWSTFLWKNDVNLAKTEVKKWTEELNKLNEEKKSGYNEKNSMKDIEKWKDESLKYSAKHREHQQKAEMGQKLVEEKNKLIQEKYAELETVKKSLKKLMDKHAGKDESVERLMDAMDATADFANGSLSQATSQAVFSQLGKDSLETLFLSYEELLDDEDDEIEIDDQIEIVAEMVDSNNKEPLFGFLQDSSPIQEFPVVEKSKIKQIKNSMESELLEFKEE